MAHPDRGGGAIGEVGRGKIEDLTQRRLARLAEENAALRAYAEEVIRRARENESLYRRLFAIEAAALRASDPEDVCFALLRGLRGEFELDFVRLWLDRTSPLGGFPMTALSERDLVWIEPGETARMGLSVERPCRLIVLRDTAFAWAEPEAARLGSLAVALLGDAERPIGALGLGAIDADRFAPGLATDFLRHLGRIVGLALEHAAARERLARQATLDPVSGARNLRFLQPRAHQPISQWFGEGRGGACICVNLVDWRDDAEQAGERLEQAAAAIQRCLRASDPVIRLRGATFAALLPGCPGERAEAIARRMIERLSALGEGEAACAGLAVAEGDDDPPLKTLVERAERAMFVAEALGGGRIERAPC